MAYVLLARGLTTDPSSGEANVTKPGSGSTITMWQSADNRNSTFGGARFKRLILDIYSSHASGSSGLKFQESMDGTTYRDLVTYTVSATTKTKYYVSVAAPFLKVAYTNSANVLTTWEFVLYGDTEERGTV